MYTYTFRAMGSQILIAMDTDSTMLNEAGLEAAAWFEEWEQSFSRFRLTSELNELNQHTGQSWQVSSSFWRVLNLALDVEKKTAGLVTPTVLNALEEAGYDISFEEIGQNISSYLNHSFAAAGSLQQIELDENQRTVRLPYGMRLDLGGIVKGWAAQQTMIRLRDAAPVLVDAGGDIAVSGAMKNGSPWAIGIDDPLQQGHSLGLVMLAEGGIATSGRDYRRWMKDNHWQHHIIDPRTERPAETDILSATVIAADVMEAEAWAKAALILGSRAAAEKLDQASVLAYLLVREDGSTIETPRFNQYRWTEKWQIQNNLLV
jgi:thiamine biosynthesis lipoprotein